LPQPGLQQQGIPDAPAGAEDGAGLPGPVQQGFLFFRHRHGAGGSVVINDHPDPVRRGGGDSGDLLHCLRGQAVRHQETVPRHG
ncbi:Helix-turn-helix domain, partial [Dysosmobacter welbionis]